MPNTPALVGAGVTAMSGGSFATAQDLAWAEDVLSAVGTVVRLPERLQDAVTGLSGSGPAYFFLVAEALMEAGVQMGLSREVSRTLVVETMQGSAALLQETGQDPEALRAMVTSPAGTTAAGIRALEAPGRALGLHGGGRRRHRAIAQPAALSMGHGAASSDDERPRAPSSSSPTSAPRTSSPAWCTRSLRRGHPARPSST